MSRDVGGEAHALMRRLFPLCRSLTGSGLRETLDVIAEAVGPEAGALRRTEIASGSEIFDWRVPDEWNLRDAYVATPDGRRVIDLRESSLHVVSYSEPVHARMRLEQLREHLHTLPEQPGLIPYRTSYYERTWGFCLSHRRLQELEDCEYEVVIDSTLGPGHMTYGEVVLPGESADLVLISTYICHPSLANDNLSGIAVATMLARALAQAPRRRFSYRILFAPGTIGPLAWLHENLEDLPRVRHGLTVSCIGDPGPFTYKLSRRGNAEVDRAVRLALRDAGAAHGIVAWEPWGGDERQFCSPGFNLPVGCLMRTPHGGFDGYHTSADSLERISPEALAEAVQVCLSALAILEQDGTYLNLSPHGEPQLGRRGLYRSAGGAVRSPAEERALLWVLNLSDGSASLSDVAERSGLPFQTIRRAAERLLEAALLGETEPAPVEPATREAVAP